MPQQLAHATSNGASLRTGDLMASGTISGSEPGSQGSMIELCRGKRFLEDGDEVVLRGRAASGVELGEVRGAGAAGARVSRPGVAHRSTAPGHCSCCLSA